MPDFYDVKNNTKGAILFGARSVGAGETVPLYLTDEQYQKYNGLGWIVGINSTVGNAYAVDGRYVSRSSVGSGTTGSGTGGAADTSLVGADVACSGTIGNWVEILAPDSARNGASVQNKDAAAIVYIYVSDSATPPAAGAKVGEIQLPVAPAYFKFDYVPRRRHWIRSTVASSVVTVNRW